MQLAAFAVESAAFNRVMEEVSRPSRGSGSAGRGYRSDAGFG